MPTPMPTNRSPRPRPPHAPRGARGEIGVLHALLDALLASRLGAGVLTSVLALALAGPASAVSDWSAVSDAEILDSVARSLSGGNDGLRGADRATAAGVRLRLAGAGSTSSSGDVAGVQRFAPRTSEPRRVIVQGLWNLDFDLSGLRIAPGGGAIAEPGTGGGEAPVPEPGAALLFGSGLALVGGSLRARRRARPRA